MSIVKRMAVHMYSIFDLYLHLLRHCWEFNIIIKKILSMIF